MKRRTFIKGAAAGLGAIGFAGLGTAEAKIVNVLQVPKWDWAADVIVIGYGAAGGNAAIAAHDVGAKVIILEKMDRPGGNSAVCQGGMVIPDTVSGAIEYYRKLSFGTVDDDMIEGFAKAMVAIPDLLGKYGASVRMGKRYPAFPALMNSRSIPAFRFNPTGQDGFRFLSQIVEGREIKVMLKTAAKSLIQDPDTREVVGVKAEHEGKALHIKASRGVVLSCGGYENNPEMMGYYNHPGLKDFIFPSGNPGNTGDGLRMASAAGAYLWHTAALQWSSFCAKAPSMQFGVAVGTGILRRRQKEENFILVNKYGNRFMRETKSIWHYKGHIEVLFFDHELAQYPHVPTYLVFDETYRTSGPIPYTRESIGPVGYEHAYGIYSWSSDNSAEIEKGWISKADTITDLAKKIHADPKGLNETISKFNKYCKDGRDPDFNRSGSSLAPLSKPPYYALELGIALVNTQGGPKRNKFAQVLDPDDKPIPRLYSAGELGSFFGFLYQEGSNYPEAWAFGRIAGTRAASEKEYKG